MKQSVDFHVICFSFKQINLSRKPWGGGLSPPTPGTLATAIISDLMIAVARHKKGLYNSTNLTQSDLK